MYLGTSPQHSFLHLVAWEQFYPSVFTVRSLLSLWRISRLVVYYVSDKRFCAGDGLCKIICKSGNHRHCLLRYNQRPCLEARIEKRTSPNHTYFINFNFSGNQVLLVDLENVEIDKVFRSVCPMCIWYALIGCFCWSLNSFV